MEWEREDFDLKPLTAQRLNQINDGIEFMRDLIDERTAYATPTVAGLVRMWHDEVTNEFNFSLQD